MTTQIIVFFADSTTVVFYNDVDSTVYSLGRDDKISRLLGFAPDLDDAKALIYSSFEYVSNIVALTKIFKLKNTLL